MTDAEPRNQGTQSTRYAFAELLKLADRMADELGSPGARCQVPIILAVMAIEALVNDLTHMVRRMDHEGAQALAGLGKHLDSSRVRPRVQLLVYCLTGESIRTDRDPYQAFSFLVDLRDALVHAVPEEWWEGPEGKWTSQTPAFVKYLADRKIASGAVTIRDLLQPEVAKWGVRVAGELVLYVLERVAKSIPTAGFILAALLQSQLDKPTSPMSGRSDSDLPDEQGRR